MYNKFRIIYPLKAGRASSPHRVCAQRYDFRLFTILSGTGPALVKAASMLKNKF